MIIVWYIMPYTPSLGNALIYDLLLGFTTPVWEDKLVSFKSSSDTYDRQK